MAVAQWHFLNAFAYSIVVNKIEQPKPKTILLSVNLINKFDATNDARN